MAHTPAPVDVTPIPPTAEQRQFVDWLREVAPYIHAFRDKTFVNSFGRDGDRLRFAQTTPLKCRVSLDASTGLISGSFVHPLTGRAAAIRGVILQKQNSALGFFLGPNRAGPVNIAPAGAPAE